MGDKIKTCYDKKFLYRVPKIKCNFCKRQINPGNGLHIVMLAWGDGYSACEKCADEFEIEPKIP